MLINKKSHSIFLFLFLLVFIVVGGCAPIQSNITNTDSIGRSYCAPGPYDKANTNGRYYASSV